MITRRQAKRIGLISGPVFFVAILFLPILEELPFEARVVIAATFWMGAWWVTEAIPIYVTAFLPLILFPSLGVTDLGATSTSYADRVVFLFLGGFILAKAVEKSNLHKRFALKIIKTVGTDPKYIVAAFMAVTWFLSGWMSNTATTMLMLPIAAAVIAQLSNEKDRGRFGLCLMLSLAYAASIGGMTTLIGTPPNAIFASLSGSLAETDVSFGKWIIVGLPIGAVSIVVAWFYMVNVGARIRGMAPIAKEKGVIGNQLAKLGSMTRDEVAVLGVFAATATAWITRGLVWKDALPMVDDSTIVIIAAVSLFLIPSYKNKQKKNDDRNNNEATESGKKKVDDQNAAKLMNWRTAVTIPWGVLILIGGGLALANAYTVTGLDQRIANQLDFLSNLPFILVILAIVAITVLVSEIMSNTASAALILPITASLAASLEIDPILLMVPATIAASYGFMMPVGTPPNAIVYSSGYVSVPRMVRAGLPLDMIGIIMVTGLASLIVPLVWS